MAPTLFTACNALPPGGAELRLGRPGASFVAPTFATTCASLPPGGAELAWGGLVRRSMARALLATPLSENTSRNALVVSFGKTE